MELKDKIINSAFELFSSKGYEKTTIREIIERAGCSKGGFYHHFKSKEEILEVIISNYLDELSKLFNKIISDEQDPFIDKFNNIFKAINQYKLDQIKGWSEIYNIFYFKGNDKILRQLLYKFKIATTKTYSEVINFGNKQGFINTKHPELVAELCSRQILWIYEAARKAINNDSQYKDEDRFVELLGFSEELIRHELGLKEQEVKFKDEALLYLHNAKEYYLTYKGE